MSVVIFRADGGPAIGAGHVMRCLALATVFRDGGWSIGLAASEQTFASVAALNDWPLEKLALTVGQEDEAAAIRNRWPKGADILVVDHYGRDATLEKACRGWAKRIVVIDDLADRPHDADVLVDVANPHAAYRGLVPERCKVLSGPDYAILHPAFRSRRAEALARRDGRPVERLLVSFGQIDAANATSSALAALQAAGFAGQIDVVLGRAAPHLAAVRAAAGERIKLHVDAQDMPRLMVEADLAVGAGGVTALERCCLGLPTVLVQLADNQRENVAMLTKGGAASDVGPVDAGLQQRLAAVLSSVLQDGARRAAMAKAGAALVDGRGTERIFEIVTSAVSKAASRRVKGVSG